MLGWLDRFFGNVGSSIGNAVSSAVHWAMHAVMSVILAVFRLVGAAWRDYLAALRAELGAAEGFARTVWGFASWLTRGLLPKIVRWAARAIASVLAFARRVYEDLQRAVARLLAYIAHVADTIYRWVLRDIWAPLKRYADLLWADLKKWGFTAWWWITHLPQLADAMIFHIARSLEKYAWQLGRMLGAFFTALIIHNLRRLLLLVEDILSAVL